MRLGRKIRWVVVGLALLAIAGETVLRLFPRLCPPQQQLKIAATAKSVPFVDDPALGARPAPLSHDTVRALDYEYVVQLDSAGFPNREPWPAEPAVVVLGNSLIVGPGVGLEGQFTTLLDEALGGVGVLDLGLAGGSPAQQLAIYHRYAEPLRPGVVVATLWVASDVDNAVQFEHWLEEGSPADFTAYRERFGTTHGGMSALKAIRDLLSGSYLLRAVYYGLAALRGDGGLRGRVTFPAGETIFLSTRAQRHLAEGVARPGFDFATDFIGPLARLRAAVDSAGARFVVVLLPSKEEVYGADAFPAVSTTIAQTRAGLDAARLPLLDLYDTFRRRGESRSPFFKRDIHFTAYGNQLVAEALADWIGEGSGGTDAPATGAPR